MKPLLADDWIEDRLTFPKIVQPKIDGVRALNMTGVLTGRSLKKHKNVHVTTLFSHSALVGLDGEMAAQYECHPEICRLTSSALGTIKGTPWMLWHLFDLVTPETRNLPYRTRLSLLNARMYEIGREQSHLYQHLRLIPSQEVNSLAELLEFEDIALSAGYEGVIIRDPDAPHKEGRSGKTPILWRIKRFVDFEFKVKTVIEGEENQNEAQTNELGNTFRSSHQENKVANGMIGAMIGECLTVVKDGDKVLFEKGQEVKVGAGRLSHEQRKYYFENQDEFKSKVHKGKFFPKGIKDKPRFPTWQTFRSEADIS